MLPVGSAYILCFVLLGLLAPRHHTVYSDHLGQGSPPADPELIQLIPVLGESVSAALKSIQRVGDPGFPAA